MKTLTLDEGLVLYSLHSTFYEIPIEFSYNLKALIFSDLHIGEKKPSTIGTTSIFIKIINLIEKHKANCIFFLGDIIESSSLTWKEDLNCFLNSLENLCVYSFFISGNHERRTVDNYLENLNFLYFYFIKDLCFYITHYNSKLNNLKKIFFAHDFGNALWLTKKQIPIFIKGLKNVFSTMIDKNDFLILGHIHEHYMFENELCCSLGCFSNDLSFNNYGLITSEEEFKIEIFKV